MSEFKIVRLNADLFPITEFERDAYTENNFAALPVEARSSSELIDSVEDADAVMVVSQTLSEKVIRAMRRCRVICRVGAGTDKIDVAAATKCGIVVANVPDFCVEEQADHAFALLLAVARKLNEMRTCTIAGEYHDGRQRCRSLRRLPGRTLGLIGFGLSARAMARRAAGFGLRVLATRRDMSIQDPLVDSLGVQMVALEELLAKSDFVSLHLPLNDHTQHLLDENRLAKMKRGSILINTARGAIVDEDALAALLATGHLAGAGLDTFAVVDMHEADSRPPNHRLFEMENVVFTPHVAAFSIDSSRDVANGSVANLDAVLSGTWPTPDHVVNPSVRPRYALTR